MPDGNALTVEEKTLLFLGPLIVASAIWLARRGWARYQKFGQVSDGEKRRLLLEALAILGGIYVLEFALMFLSAR
jgi:hypothetical protein